MTRCRREGNLDIICTSYKTASNRSTRLLLLEIVAEAFLKEHENNIQETFGEGFYCECPTCEKAREALRMKPTKK